jgi:cytochrome c biogenesis protein CcmG/thiol:disulfide interchange protein DsbE
MLSVAAAFAGAAMAIALMAPRHAAGQSSQGRTTTAAKDPELVDLAGFQRILSAQRGHPLLLTIWATWCEPCRDEYPMVNELAKQFAPQGLRVVGISYDDDAEINLVRHFLARNNPIFPNYRKRMGHVDQFDRGVDPTWRGELPVNFFYAADGRLMLRIVGEQPRAQYEQAIRGILLASGASHR